MVRAGRKLVSDEEEEEKGGRAAHEEVGFYRQCKC